MLETVKSVANRSAAARGFDVEIMSVATATPPFRLTQADAAERARALYPHLEALWPLYDNAGIELRYNCEPIEWYLKPHSWEERTASFQKHALDLLEDVTLKAVEAAGVELGDYRHPRHQYDHGARHSEPRRQAFQPAQV